MSLLTLTAPVQWPPQLRGTALSYVSTPLIDAASEKWAIVFQAPKTGSIDRVCFATRNVVTGATVDVRLETVDGTTGDPTGTLVAANTNNSQVINSTDDNLWFEVTLTAAGAVTKGDIIALVVVNSAGSPGNITLAGLSGPSALFPYGDLFTASWAKSSAVAPVCAVRYNDATYPIILGNFPVSAINTVSVNTGTTPDEAGNLFTVPVDSRAVGIWADGLATGGNTRDFQLVLYDSDGTTALETITIDATNIASTISLTTNFYFSGTQLLRRGRNYRVTLKPTTASSNSLVGFSVTNTTFMDHFPGGQAIYRTHRTDAGGWTDTTTERLQIGVLLDQIDDGGVGIPVMRAGRQGAFPVY